MRLAVIGISILLSLLFIVIIGYGLWYAGASSQQHKATIAQQHLISNDMALEDVLEPILQEREHEIDDQSIVVSNDLHNAYRLQLVSDNQN